MSTLFQILKSLYPTSSAAEIILFQDQYEHLSAYIIVSMKTFAIFKRPTKIMGIGLWKLKPRMHIGRNHLLHLLIQVQDTGTAASAESPSTVNPNKLIVFKHFDVTDYLRKFKYIYSWGFFFFVFFY